MKATTLESFRFVKLAFETVLADQPYPAHMNVRIDGSVKVPQKLLATFKRVEAALSKLHGKKGA